MAGIAVACAAGEHQLEALVGRDRLLPLAAQHGAVVERDGARRAVEPRRPGRVRD